MKKLLLLGGGHAHLQVMRAFATEALPGAELTLVTPWPTLTYSGMVPGFVAGHYTLEQCTVPLAPMAERAGVRLLQASATAIDSAARTVTLADGRTLAYDALSLDVGATQDRDAIPGAREHGLFVRPIEAFAQLWGRMLEIAQAKPLCVVVIGGGAAGVELALAMHHRLGDRSRVSLVTGGSAPLPSHPPGVQRRALAALKRRKVTVLEDVCAEISASHVLLGRGARVACDAAVIALPAVAPGWLQGCGLALDERGFVATGPTLQSSSHPEVFAAGDVSARLDVAHPRSGVYAVRAGAPLALNLRRFLAGGQLEPWRPQPRALNLLACGERYAIASWGKLAAEGRWVWHWKDRIDRGFINAHGGAA
ncbi:FAD-dependent oxidoreductase [Variovorax sp. YR752]|uniref:FAD-dependent oxidoreductase n=1 Tax=Variovorax sp. YR752 TaxID=1884383 RepID=UPI0031382597